MDSLCKNCRAGWKEGKRLLKAVKSLASEFSVDKGNMFLVGHLNCVSLCKEVLMC